jgi:hypothetical protein
MPSFQAHNLAAAFLSGAWSPDGMRERGAEACGRRALWLHGLVRRVWAAFGDPPLGLTADALAAFIEHDPGFGHARRTSGPDFFPRRTFWVAPSMTPAPGPPSGWGVPDLPTSARLAEWLGLGVAELEWLAGCRGGAGRTRLGPLHHYTYRWLSGASGKVRLLEMPKQRLKAVQRRILHGILDRIPPHEAAHGYRSGRSIATFAAAHAGRTMVLRLDLHYFFPSIASSRVHALFATAGYPAAVARLLTGLCTHCVLGEVWRAVPCPGDPVKGRRLEELLRVAHLPQGAPTSPALANLCTYRLDCRLAALAQTAGARYTRYADDLAFSGDEPFERCARRFHVEVCRLTLEEGFEVNPRKTRFMRPGVRQQLVGIVLNRHPNLPRVEYDRLKAILFNCIQHGPESQNRTGLSDFRAYLAGRLAYLQMLNPSRGRKLRSLFDRIAWP